MVVGASNQDNNLKLVTGELLGHIRGNCWHRSSQKRIMPPEKRRFSFSVKEIRLGLYNFWLNRLARGMAA